MKSYDVVGFIADADVWCEDCCPYPDGAPDSEGNPAGPIFAESEFDSPQHCAGCGTLLSTSLTSHGAEYVIAAVLEFYRNGKPKGGDTSEGVLAFLRQRDTLTAWVSEFSWIDGPSLQDLIDRA